MVVFCLLAYIKMVYLLFDDFFFQAEDGIRDLVRSRGLGDVYKRQIWYTIIIPFWRKYISMNPSFKVMRMIRHFTNC